MTFLPTLNRKNVLLYVFWGLAGLLFYARVSDLASLNFILTPLLSIVLIFEYHRKVGEDQTLYFSFIFCMLGDLMTISSDFYNFTSGLIAYWGASILFNFPLGENCRPHLRLP